MADTASYRGDFSDPAGEAGGAPIHNGAREVNLGTTRPRKQSRVGDLFIFLTSADRDKIRTYPERQRYITIGALMMVTAAQGFYAACLLASIGFKKPFDHVLAYGIFFALAVYFIDRSIIGYVAPAKRVADAEPVDPGKLTPVLAVRLLIAAAAAILMSEMVLLQFFAPDIRTQVQADHLDETRKINVQVTQFYQEQISILQGQITSAQRTVNERNHDYLVAERQANCQEFGCPGIKAGPGLGFRAAEKNLQEAQTRLKDAQANLQSVTRANDPQINKLNKERNAKIGASQQTIDNANALLTREEAFWQLTVEHGTVAFWRIMLTLLILGIDLAPLLVKLTGRSTVHDKLVRHDDLVAIETSLADVQDSLEQIQTRKLATSSRERLHRERDNSRVETALQRVLAETDEERFGIKLNTDLRKRRLYRFYTAGRSQSGGGYKQTAQFTQPADDQQDAPASGADNQDHFPHEQYNADDLQFDDQFDGAFADAAVGDMVDPDLNEDVAEIIFGNSWEGLILSGRWALRDRMAHADGGSGGVVWRAKDVDNAIGWYVVKTFSTDIDGPADSVGNLQLRSFYSEKRIQRVHSDNIGQIVDFGTDKGFHYVVYPLYKPGSLSLLCQRSETPRTLRWCADVVRQVLSGLIDASDSGFVHLDIKPGNIVQDGERVRIIDWGLSRAWRSADSTYTVVPRGSPFFACPEQLERPEPGWDKPVADLYSVGALFYWLIALEAPLRRDVGEDGADLLTYMKLIVGGVRPRLVHELVPNVPPQLSELIDQWLSYDPDARVPPGTGPDLALRAARDALDALLPQIPPMTVG